MTRTDPESKVISAIDGLTKREHFAALAMQGLMAFNNRCSKSNAIRALEMADALIEALNNESLLNQTK